MNYKAKSGLGTVNKILAIILAAAIVFLIAAIAFNLGDKGAPAEEAGGAVEDVAVIDEFVAGTYGGVEFKTVEDVVNFYKESYDYTKTLTAQYIDADGNQQTFYKLVGDENLEIKNLLVEGNSNSMIDNLVPGIAGGLFSGNVIGLSPSGNRNPLEDKRGDNGEFDCTTSQITPDDILAANVVDNGDGTITLTLQPKEVILSMPGKDSQGKFFNSLGDISSVVESISVLSFSQGTINDNFVVAYRGGTGAVKINVATKEIVEADYSMNVHIDVQHANVTVLKDKSASLDIVYSNHYPASDEYMMEKRSLKRA